MVPFLRPPYGRPLIVPLSTVQQGKKTSDPFVTRLWQLHMHIWCGLVLLQLQRDDKFG